MIKHILTPHIIHSDNGPHNIVEAVVVFVVTLPENMLKIFYLWQKRSTERRQMSYMSDHLLQDIGLDRKDLNKEMTKPFWKA